MAHFGDIEVGLSSPPDRDQLVADLLVDHAQLAEVRLDSGGLVVEIYPRADGRPWTVAESDLQAALSAAVELLGE